MIVTRLKPPKLSENMISDFGGINKNPTCPENSFCNTQNTSSSLFPLLSTREKRASLCTFETLPSALHTVNGITLIVGTSLFYNNILQFDGLSQSNNKQIVSMGSNIIIFPDGYYINTLTANEDGICSDQGFLAQKNIIDSIPVQLFPCLIDNLPIVSYNEPISPKDNALWLNPTKEPSTLSIYSKENNSWTPVAATHLCIRAYGIANNLSVGDTVEISGSNDDINININGTNSIAAIGDDYIIISGLIDSYQILNPSKDCPFTVERSIPILDFVCEHENRLFGCRYGKNSKGDFVNEIYSSKLGDPKNWNSYAGISTDSYTASCGSEGAWTGIASHMGYVVFFKENRIHRLFGTKPSNFKLYQDEYPGVKLGSEKSLCLINGSLYYHSENGIYCYSGSSPFCVSSAFGQEKFSYAVSSACKNVYYTSLTDQNGKRQFFSYDIQRQIWHREDESDFSALSYYCGNILGIKNECGIYTLELLFSSDIPTLCRELYNDKIKVENNLEWFAESGKMGLSIDRCKFINKVKVRLEADADSTVDIYLQVDSSGFWENCGSFTSSKLSPCIFEVVPPRCDHFNIKLVGYGKCKIYSLTKVIEIASEVF